jgi:16S rRNA (guanine527-N7)-methyltransferase
MNDCAGLRHNPRNDMQKDFQNELWAQLIESARELGIKIDDSHAAMLLQHLALLAKWNRTHNLTAITDPKEMVIQHVLDSQALAPHIKGRRILDIGTGGGFPGLPLAIVNPDQHWTLLDSRGKRIEFVRHIVSRLGLGNVSLENCRIENYRPEEKFDTLTARAFSSLQNLVLLSRSCQQTGTRILAMKGKAPYDEIQELPEHWQSRLEVTRLEVPGLDAERHLVTIEC